ncbi:tetratricopeptide repeat protein [Rhizobium sp. KVB221]|uniref:Ancillary SecYEG translocon subunit n=1 Tax=Rhizobium setariae TaxID=2801340 RepID=A0A937CP72_9HYPH|nr:tetratricopeptide repeat protein [Rhizobium setariae]MBL0372098.1 tetratricopeptide repeat protein [Rhizobium setariae]
MMNDNDSFIREVNEELRSEQMRSIWRRFAPFIIGTAVLIVVGVAGSGIYQWWETKQSSASGDRYLTAIKDAQENRADDAAKDLEALTKDGFGAYPVLARMRLATLKAEKGDAAAAVSDFSAIGKDQSIPVAIRNAARLRAAWLLVDAGTYDQVATEVEELAVPSSAMRHSARETLGLAAYKAGDLAKARDWFQLIVDDSDAPSGATSRARTMLGLIVASGKLS